MKFLFDRIRIKHHCLIVVAEGSARAVQDLKICETGLKDKSGNPVLPDIGDILKKEIKHYAKKNDIDITLKYLDPTYMIRGCPANTFDMNYCA